jgi:hypothetical protein
VEASPDTVIAGLKQIEAALEGGKRVLLAPSQPDAEKLCSMGFHAVAVTAHVNGHVEPQLIEPFKGADVLVVIDEVEELYFRQKTLGIAIKAVAGSVKYLDLQNFANDARSRFTVAEWIDDNKTSADELGLLIDKATGEAPERSDPNEYLDEQTYRSKFGAVSWKNRNVTTDKPYEFQIAGVIPARKLVLFYGESQSGKSFSAFDLAVHVATGQDFNDKRVKKGGVIYCFVEKGGGARVRMQAFQQFHNLPDELPFIALTRRFDIFNDPDEVKRLAEECKLLAAEWDVSLDVIVIDTHDKATPGANEIEKRDVSTILDRYEKLIELTGAGVWVIHHANASGNLRGSLILYNAIETVISITPQEIKGYGPTRDQDNRQIRRAVVKKQSEGEAGYAWDFVLKVVEVGKNAHGEAITSCIVVPPNGGTASEGPRMLKGNALICFNALMSALVQNGVPAPAGVHVPKGLNVVDRKYWLNEFDSKASEMEPDEVKRKNRVMKAMERAIKLFVERGYIGIQNIGKEQWAWWTGKYVPGVPGTKTAREVVSEQLSSDDTTF